MSEQTQCIHGRAADEHCETCHTMDDIGDLRARLAASESALSAANRRNGAIRESLAEAERERDDWKARAQGQREETDKAWAERDALQREVERLRGRVDYYESTVCLPGNPIRLACGETTEVVQPVKLGELVARLVRLERRGGGGGDLAAARARVEELETIVRYTEEEQWCKRSSGPASCNMPSYSGPKCVYCRARAALGTDAEGQ